MENPEVESRPDGTPFALVVAPTRELALQIHKDALLLGAGLALEVSGRASDLATGINQAREALDSGAATEMLNRLRAFKG